MNSSLYEGIQIAEGYQFTDQLTSPYHLAGHLKSGCDAVLRSDVNGNEQEELLDEDTWKRSRQVRISPDGSTLYYHDEHIYAKDLVVHPGRMQG